MLNENNHIRAKWLGTNQDELWERQSGRPALGHRGLDFKSISPEE